MHGPIGELDFVEDDRDTDTGYRDLVAPMRHTSIENY